MTPYPIDRILAESITAAHWHKLPKKEYIYVKSKTLHVMWCRYNYLRLQECVLRCQIRDGAICPDVGAFLLEDMQNYRMDMWWKTARLLSKLEVCYYQSRKLKRLNLA